MTLILTDWPQIDLRVCVEMWTKYFKMMDISLLLQYDTMCQQKLPGVNPFFIVNNHIIAF